jgi:hypothetical protein
MLKPGERVRLITQLADRLGEMAYPEMDLHLRQFNLPWTDQWSGTNREYALRMLEDGGDPELLALHEHLFGFSGAPAGEPPDFWKAGHFRLFVSHVSANKAFAAELSHCLEEYGVSGFVAHEDIEPSREWIEEIERALFTCDALLAVLSPGFKESDWTDQEVGFCHGRRAMILSVRDGLDPYGFIGRYQAINRQGRSAQDLSTEIVRILAQHPKTATKMAEALVGSFERSESFAQAKERVALLGLVSSWTPELLRGIESAVEENNQVQGAWGVPGQIQRILQAHGGSPSATPEPNVDLFEPDDDLPF